MGLGEPQRSVQGSRDHPVRKVTSWLSALAVQFVVPIGWVLRAASTKMRPTFRTILPFFTNDFCSFPFTGSSRAIVLLKRKCLPSWSVFSLITLTSPNAPIRLWLYSTEIKTGMWSFPKCHDVFQTFREHVKEFHSMSSSFELQSEAFPQSCGFPAQGTYLNFHREIFLAYIFMCLIKWFSQ